ncbi:MAG: YfcE family phosphodiesterase [Alkalispirochaetaceae bacterium]
MRVAVISDIHDNIWHLETALRKTHEEKAEVLLVLGDFCAPFTLAQIGDGFSGAIHAVFGNNDGDTFLLTTIASKYAQVTLHGHLGELELDGKKIAINHYPDIAERLADSGAYDAVFSGHDHKKYQERRGETLWANPGEIMGRFGEPSFGLYETGSGHFRHINL